MSDKAPTPEELQRIDRREENYSDEDWEICPQCMGSGYDPPGTDQICTKCKSFGEVKTTMKSKEDIKAEIYDCTMRLISVCNGSAEMVLETRIAALEWVLDGAEIAEGNKE